jgi:hypothetical protein
LKLSKRFKPRKHDTGIWVTFSRREREEKMIRVSQIQRTMMTKMAKMDKRVNTKSEYSSIKELQD